MTLQNRANAHADKITALGETLADSALADFRRVRTDLATELVALWHAGDQDRLNVALVSAARRLIAAAARAARQIDRSLSDTVGRAFLLGAEHANDRLRTLDLDWVSVDQLLNPRRSDIGDVAGLLVTRAEKAIELLNPMLVGVTGQEGVLAALGATERAINDAQSGVTFETARAAADGAAAAADVAGARRVWVAERDACVHCLAYAGIVAQPGAVFPHGLTFGSKPLRPYGTLTNPPLHPHCRCTVEIIHPDDNESPAALQREAKRSILRGWSLESESQTTRLRAADHLLAVGAGLPKSVETYARKAVSRGEFPTRTVPTGT